MYLVAIDHETSPIRPNCPIPRLKCVSWWDGEEGRVLSAKEGLEKWIELLTDEEAILGFFNGPFEALSIARYAAEEAQIDIWELILTKIEDGKWIDLQVREPLICTAVMGYIPAKISLSSLVRKYLHTTIEEDEKDGLSGWRLRYNELSDNPNVWPLRAKQYALNDAKYTYECIVTQYNKYVNFTIATARGIATLFETDTQVKGETLNNFASIFLGYTGAQGIPLNQERLKVELDKLKASSEELVGPLTKAGLFGEGKTEVLRALVSDGYFGNPPKTDPSTRFPCGQIATDSDTIEQAPNVPEDSVLFTYIAYKKIEKTISTYFKPSLNLDYGRGRYNVLVETGRTSMSNRNYQNCPRSGNFRECHKAIDGHVFLGSDYSNIEMRAAATFFNMMGWESKLYQAYLNDPDFDPHVEVARHLWRYRTGETFSYTEFKAALKMDKKKKEMRQFAKIPNFGYLGGMVPSTLVVYARGYDQIITLKDAEDGYKAWHESDPAYARFLTWGALRTNGGVKAATIQPHSGRIRSGMFFCAFLNTHFQGYAADGAKEAMKELLYALFVKGSFKSWKPNLFIHDEFRGMCREEDVDHDYKVLNDCMIRGMMRAMGEMPVTVEADACKSWKKAPNSEVKNGKLTIDFD